MRCVWGVGGKRGKGHLYAGDFIGFMLLLDFASRRCRSRFSLDFLMELGVAPPTPGNLTGLLDCRFTRSV